MQSEKLKVKYKRRQPRAYIEESIASESTARKAKVVLGQVQDAAMARAYRRITMRTRALKKAKTLRKP